MITHILQTFSKLRYRLNQEQAAVIQDMLDHKEDMKLTQEEPNPYIILEGGRVHIGSIEGIHPISKFPQEMAELENQRAYHNFPSLPEPRNHFTREQNIQRMKDAALKSKAAEQAKYGIQKWSTPIEKWLKAVSI